MSSRWRCAERGCAREILRIQIQSTIYGPLLRIQRTNSQIQPQRLSYSEDFNMSGEILRLLFWKILRSLSKDEIEEMLDAAGGHSKHWFIIVQKNYNVRNKKL